jgi:hypothetical protein
MGGQGKTQVGHFTPTALAGCAWRVGRSSGSGYVFYHCNLVADAVGISTATALHCWFLSTYNPKP